MKVLVVVANKQAAFARGCAAATHCHRTHKDMRFWWPALEAYTLQGLRFDLITIDPDAYSFMTPRNWMDLRAYATTAETVLVGCSK